MESAVQQIILNNDIDCCVKSIPSSNSITIGLFLDVSLPNETESITGISHFLEHMCFRGTRKRTSFEITHQVDAMGGYINAYTSKEFTCYYLTILPESLEEGIDVLFDIVFNSVLKDDAIDLEKSIINEEIKMYEDTPDEKIHDVFSQHLFRTSSLGNPILGTKDTIYSFNSDILKTYYKQYFIEQNINIVVAGKIVDVDGLSHILNQYLSQYKFKSEKKLEQASKDVVFKKTNFHEEKVLEQNHICLGFPGYYYLHDDRYVLTLISTIMGGSMSSRLFQSIREKRGLAYSVYSSAGFYKDLGSFSIYAGTSKETYNEAKDAIDNELALFKNKGITKEELDRSKKQLKGHLTINLESSASWVNWLGRQLIYKSQNFSVGTIIQRLESVSIDDIERVGHDIFNDEYKVIVSLGINQKKC